jgi:YtkA-like
VSRAQAARARGGAGRKIDSLPRGYASTLLAMFSGLAIAVLVVAAGVGALLTEGVKKGDTAGAVAAGATEHERGVAASPAADISITAEHLGDLRVGIEARVTMNAEKRALAQAKVEAYLDMKEMPGAHKLGPLELRPGEQPGVYTTVTTVPMVGDYEVRVEMHDPVHAEARKVVPVGVVGKSQ